MENFFSKNLYFQGLKKIKISGIAFSLIIVLLNAFLPIIGIIDGSEYHLSYQSEQLIGHNMVIPFCMLIVLLVPIIAHDMFSFLNERNQSDFYHSIPQKRTCVYLSFTAALITWAFCTVIASTFINTLLWSMAKTYTFTFSTIILGMLPYLVLAVQMAGVMILAMTVTGTKISNFLVAILFFLFFRVMSSLSVVAIDNISTVVNVDYGVFKYFGIEFFLPVALFIGLFDGEATVYINATLQLYSLLVGIGFLALGGLAYNNRRSESATKSAPSKRLQHIYRFAVTLPFVFLIAFSIITDGFESYQIILVIIAILVYILYELITTKKIKNIVKTLPLMIIPVAVTLLMVGGINLTANSIDNYRFDSDEVDGFCFVNSYSNTYENLMTDEVFVSGDRVGEILADALEFSINQNEYSYKHATFERVLIKLDSGRVIARKLYIPVDDYEDLVNIMNNSSEYRSAYLEIPHPDDISTATCYNGFDHMQSKKIYRAFYDEYNSLSTADKMLVKKSRGEYVAVGNINISGYLDGVSYDSYYNIVFDLLPQTALEYIEMLGVNKDYNYWDVNVESAFRVLDNNREKFENCELSYCYGELSFSKVSGTFENGSVSKSYEIYTIPSVIAVRDILEILVSDPNSFVYGDPNTLYKVRVRVETGLLFEAEEEQKLYDETVAIDFNPEHTSADLVGAALLKEAAETEMYYSEDSIYVYEDFFISISDATMARIVDIMTNANKNTEIVE